MDRDYDVLEEDLFLLLAQQGDSRAPLGSASARALARRVRTLAEQADQRARQNRASVRSVAFDLHALLPVPLEVTTDGHGSYPSAIRSMLGKTVRHRNSAYLNNRLEQDHRGIKGRIRCMLGLKDHDAASRFCREHGKL